MSELYVLTRRAKHPCGLRDLLHHNENDHDKWLLEHKEPHSLSALVSVSIPTRDMLPRPAYIVHPQLPLTVQNPLSLRTIGMDPRTQQEEEPAECE